MEPARSDDGMGADRKNGGTVVPRELSVLALIKGNEQYVFVYDDPSRPLLIDAFRQQAADPRLSLSWFDAAVLTDKAREQARDGTQALPPSRKILDF